VTSDEMRNAVVVVGIDPSLPNGWVREWDGSATCLRWPVRWWVAASAERIGQFALHNIDTKSWTYHPTEASAVAFADDADD
jgi:hypothetical protein